ncbi:hypothetical protein GO755_26420 [Spirosoma sp. HMF4905]|uniref:Uncharacterized protein n=1 Tax=Spirosoma arboris TaxID=2682092 RepID=A0A7K1SIE9_9BACT|nr:hypothetical protein [Spirosoma arboris]MVM33601.1 hypothetical protein [Spirosoma arboris]
MNVDLTNTFKDARQHLTMWKARYSPAEYPQKVVMNIFYRKYTIDKMWSRVINQTHPTWQIAYQNNKLKYAEVAQHEIVPVLEALIKSDKKVSTSRYSDFAQYVKSASQGDENAIKAVEFTYFLHRIFDELTTVWISMVSSGDTKINAIAKMTGAILAPETPITGYADIESIFDQLGAEKYLYSLFMKEMNNQI